MTPAPTLLQPKQKEHTMTFNHAEQRKQDIEVAMYWRDYVLLPLLGFFMTVMVIIATGSVLYPLIGFVVAMVVIFTIFHYQDRASTRFMRDTTR